MRSAIEEAPAWIQITETPAFVSPNTNQVAEGIAYILIDQQVNARSQETYMRVVKDFVTQGGVQGGSTLTIDFDPSFERLVFHHISLIRGGTIITNLSSDRIRIMQREPGLESHIYAGTATASVFLEDVRVGDRLDFAYTRKGFNPILEGKYVGSFTAQWSTPVRQTRFRILIPTERKLSFRCHGAEFIPAVSNKAGTTEYLWDLRDLPPVYLEDSVPSWYPSLPWVQLSEFQSWEEVGDWATRLYASPANLPSEFLDVVRQWNKTNGDPDAKVLEALRFVQDEVRYLGIEAGLGAHKPNPPAEVLARRFGDCKDKALLLCTTLQQMGLEARPVLVSAAYKGHVADLLPSPYAFDHVVTIVTLGESARVLDPTISNQKGSINERFVPDYGKGLVVQAGATGLRDLPVSRAGYPTTVTHEYFRVEAPQKPTELKVRTTVAGADADRLRSSLRNSTVEDIQKLYLNFYAVQFPEIAAVGKLAVREAGTHNSIETEELYSVTNFWTLQKGGNHYEVEFYPRSLAQALRQPNVRLRQMPLAIRYPHKEVFLSEVQFRTPWPIDTETNVITSPAFRFVCERSYSKRRMVLRYEYEALTNLVSLEDINLHLNRLDEVHNNLGYTLSWEKPAGPFRIEHINWPISLLAFFYSALVLVGGIVLYRYDIPLPGCASEPTGYHYKLDGLGGWLFLVGLGLAFNFIAAANMVVSSHGSFAIPQWQARTVQGGEFYHWLYGPLLIFELLGNITVVGLSGLAIVLFFQKRQMFRLVFVVLFVSIAVFAVADHLLATRVPPLAVESGTAKTAIQAIMRCLVWVPYAYQSKRVKSTFRRVYAAKDTGQSLPPPLLAAQPGE